MARPELGTKRVCPTTGRKFYDLNRTPIISPYTGQVVTFAVAPVRGRAEPIAARPAAEPEEDNELEATGDAELISLEEADDEAAGTKTAGDDEIEIEDDGAAADDTFLEEDVDGDDDVTDLIGEGIEDDEEP